MTSDSIWNKICALDIEDTHMIIAMQKAAPLWLEDQIKSGRILGQIVAPKSK